MLIKEKKSCIMYLDILFLSVSFFVALLHVSINQSMLVKVCCLLFVFMAQ